MEIYIENSRFGELEKKGELYLTTKADKENHGYGLKNVNNCVKKYNGALMINANANVFCVSIYIPFVN